MTTAILRSIVVLQAAVGLLLAGRFIHAQDQKTIVIPDRRVGSGSPMPQSIPSGTFIGVAPRGIFVRDVGQQRLVLIDRATTIEVSAEGDASFLTQNSPVMFRGVLDSNRSAFHTEEITVYKVITKKPTVTGNNRLYNRSNESMQRFMVVDDQNRIVNEGANVVGKVASSNPLVVGIMRDRFPVRLEGQAKVTVSCLVDDFALCSEGDRVSVRFRSVRSNDNAIADWIQVTRSRPFSDLLLPSNNKRGAKR